MTTAVLIPTFRRNAALMRAVRSVFAQSSLPAMIVIADNAPEGGARAVVERLTQEAPCPILYRHVPEPGVSNARNAGIKACGEADRIAMLDDDESASPGWLAALEAAADQHGAAVVFGPVSAKAHAAGAVRDAWLTRLYSRAPALNDGPIAKPYGCGNSLIDRRRAPLPQPVFDPLANETGGEDDRLFSVLKSRGAVFAWASAAHVVEHVGPDRGAWTALARRAFAAGQGPSQDAAERREWLALAFWMSVGAAQALVFSSLAAPARLLGAGACAACLDRAIQGAGKLIWLERLAPRFYGAALAGKAGQG